MNTEPPLVREYTSQDLEQLIAVYQSAFAEPPWNEYMKCTFCNDNYGREEMKRQPAQCKKCSKPLQLKEFWSPEEIQADLRYAQTQESPIVLVSEANTEVIGFSWGYTLPLEKFPFLKGKVNAQANYMDEIAVRGDIRKKGVGKALGRAYLKKIQERGIPEIILRTDERNESSMGLFKSLGFASTGIYDPEYPSRVYLRKILP